MRQLQVGQRVVAVKQAFAVDIGDTGVVVSLDGQEENPFTGLMESRVTVHVDNLNGNLGTEADVWQVSEDESVD